MVDLGHVSSQRSGGVSGYSGIGGGPTCTACHNSPNDSDPTVTLSGPASLAAGATGTFTLQIVPDASAQDANGGGLDVAVDGGTLIAITGQGTRLDSGEIVQSTPKNGSTVSWDFQWQAPATSGTFTMSGAGLSVNFGQGAANDETAVDTLQIVVGSVANQPPAADAGPDQTVTDTDNSGAEMVTLDGSGSSDPDGTIVSYEWSDGGTPLPGGTGPTPTVNLAVGTHTITLTVTDDNGATDSDDVIITVDPFTPGNQPPAADAGPDQTVTDTDNSGAEMVTLDGSGSSDPDGTIVSYEWSEGGTPLPGGTGPTPTVNLAVGTRTITLTVTDDNGATDSDDVIITVEGTAARPLIEALIDDVDALVVDGSLNRGQGNSLISKLENALKSLEKGNEIAATNQIRAFINQLQGLINGGVLSQAEGQPLIDAAIVIVDRIMDGG